MVDQGKHVQKYQENLNPEESQTERVGEKERVREKERDLTFWYTLSQHKLKTLTALLSERQKKTHFYCSFKVTAMWSQKCVEYLTMDKKTSHKGKFFEI